VTCNQSIETILVQILEKFLIEIGQVFPQPLYNLPLSIPSVCTGFRRNLATNLWYHRLVALRC
jgi:hypothetical protein